MAFGKEWPHSLGVVFWKKKRRGGHTSHGEKGETREGRHRKTLYGGALRKKVASQEGKETNLGEEATIRLGAGGGLACKQREWGIWPRGRCQSAGGGGRL